jgi:hypothetical protein
MNKKEVFKNALHYAKMAKNASEIQDVIIDDNIEIEITNMFNESHFKFDCQEVTFFRHGSHIEMLIIDEGENLIFLFPETSGLLDWLDNFKIRQVEIFHKIKAHRGHVEQYNKFRDIIIKEVKQRGKQFRNIIFAGWSLGGAMQALSMWFSGKLYNAKQRDKFIGYSFGTPRTFNKKGAKDFNKMFENYNFRIVNPNDPVPKGPFKFGFWKYWHVATKIKICKGHILKKIFKFWNLKKWIIKEQVNHHIDEYITILEKNVRLFK